MSISGRHKHKLVWISEGGCFKCSGCKEKGGNGRFTCNKCKDFTMHRDCAQLSDVYENPIHAQVQLRFRRQTIISHNCTVCRTQLKGFVFESPSRNLRLHPLCVTLPLNFTFGDHINHVLQLCKDGEGIYSCNFCSHSNHGWRYVCQQCPYALDLNCAKLDLQGLLHTPVKNEDAVEHGDGRRNAEYTNIAIGFLEFVSEIVGGLGD